MKKVIVLVLSMVFMLTFTSCFFFSGLSTRQVKTDGVEEVGEIPAFFEKQIETQPYLFTDSIQVENILLYCDGIDNSIRIDTYDFAKEEMNSFILPYKTADYLCTLYPCENSGFFLELTPSDDSGKYQNLLVKCDLVGNVIWEASLSLGNAWICDVVEAENGDVYMAGYTSVYSEEFADSYDDYAYDEKAFVAKLDKNGNVIWETGMTDNAQYSYFYRAEYVENTGLVVLYNAINADDTETLSVICMDENGNVLWNTSVFHSYYDYNYLDVVDGQIYFGLEYELTCQVFSLDLQGNLLWSKEFTDDTDIFMLEDTRENQVVLSKTDQCFTLNPDDGSVDRYFLQEKIGGVYRIYYFDDYYILLSNHKCGGVYDGFTRMWDLYEDVYSAYDYDGNLLWRKGFTYE